MARLAPRYARRMRARCTSICLCLLFVAFGAMGCSETAVAVDETVTTAAPATTTTTISQARVALAGMTLRQKAAQVLLLTFSGTTLTANTADLLATGPPGGLLILGHNVEDPEQMQTLTSSLQQAAAASGLLMGLFIAVDEEGGKVQRIKQGAPELASARTMGTDSTPGRAYELARLTGRSLLAQGINMNLAPVADVVDDDSSFLYDRTFSGDTQIVSDFVSAIVQATQAQGVISVVKHFPGHGSAAGNTHTEDAISGAAQQDYESIHLPPFSAAIAAGVEGVMMAHIVAAPYDAQDPASISRAVVEGLLRGRLGFQGLVVTDDISMAAVLSKMDAPAPQPGDTELTEDEITIGKEIEGVVAALNAGCDLIILTELETKATAVLDGLVAAIEQGAVSQTRLDEAVLRILDLKHRYAIIAPEIPPTTTTAATTEPPKETGQ